MTVYTARHVLPVARDPIADAAVAVAGERIVAVGVRDAVLAEARAGAGSGVIERPLGSAARLDTSWPRRPREYAARQ